MKILACSHASTSTRLYDTIHLKWYTYKETRIETNIWMVTSNNDVIFIKPRCFFFIRTFVKLCMPCCCGCYLYNCYNFHFHILFNSFCEIYIKWGFPRVIEPAIHFAWYGRHAFVYVCLSVALLGNFTIFTNNVSSSDVSSNVHSTITEWIRMY